MVGALKASDIDAHFRGFRKGGEGDGNLSPEEQMEALRKRERHEAQLGHDTEGAGEGRASDRGGRGRAVHGNAVHGIEFQGSGHRLGDTSGSDLDADGNGNVTINASLSASARAAMERRAQARSASEPATGATARGAVDLADHGSRGEEDVDLQRAIRASITDST